MKNIINQQTVAEGFDVNSRHVFGWTALQCAAINGQVDAVRFLLSKGSDVNAGDEFVNVYKTAKEKGVHYLDGNYRNNFLIIILPQL